MIGIYQQCIIGSFGLVQISYAMSERASGVIILVMIPVHRYLYKKVTVNVKKRVSSTYPELAAAGARARHRPISAGLYVHSDGLGLLFCQSSPQ